MRAQFFRPHASRPSVGFSIGSSSPGQSYQCNQFCELVHPESLRPSRFGSVTLSTSSQGPEAGEAAINPPANVHRLPNRDTALKALYDDLSAKACFRSGRRGRRGTRRGQAASGDSQGRPVSLALRGRHRTDPEPRGRTDHDGRFRAPFGHPDQIPAFRRGARRCRRCTLLTASTMPTRSCRRTSIRRARSASASRARATSPASTARISSSGPGDMVLTPNDTWHNHGTVGNEQALNLSVLDLPLVEMLNADSLRPRLQGRRERPARFQEGADRALLRRLLAEHLRLWRPDAAFCRQEIARRRPRLRRCSSIAGRWCANCSASHKDREGDPMKGC